MFLLASIFMNKVLKTDVETNKEEKNTEIICVLFLIYLIFLIKPNLASTIHEIMGNNKI